MLRYALYTRKSDERREVTEKSTGEQIAACRALAPGLGVIVREFEESKSAKRPGVRPLFDQMIRLVEQGEVNAILCWKVDRLARNMKEGGMVSQLLIDGQLREIRTPNACHKPGDNILPLVLETATSTQYSLDLKVNVVRGLGGHFERGGWNACAPQGYRNDRDLINPKVGIVVADEPRFTLIRKGWDMMLTGAYSPAEVARTLNDVYGYRTRKTLERGGTRLSRSYAYKIFTNPFYVGYTWYKGDVRPGAHPAMVTEVEFGRVQELLRASMVPHAQTHEFAYTGLMRCGACGAMVTAELHMIKAAGGTRKPYRFYRCADSNGKCTKRGLSEHKVEEAIKRALSGLSVEPELCQIAEENLTRALEHRSDAAEAVHAQQNAALEDLEQQQGRLMSMWLRGLLTDEERYRAAEAKLAKEKQDLLLKAGACRDELGQMRANAQASFGYVRYARDGFLVGDARRRREIAKALALEYVFFGRERRVEIAVKPLLVEVVRYADGVGDALSLPPLPLPPDTEADARVSAAERLQGLERIPAVDSPTPTGDEGKTTLKLRSFEPRIIGSGSRKSGTKMGAVLSGRGHETSFEPKIQLELTPKLMEALRGDIFPDITSCA